jgi:integrase
VNPSNACKLPRATKPEIKPLDSDQITAFLKAIQGHQYESLYKVDLFTGMRQSEILGLTWDCIQGDTICICRQLQLIKGTYQFFTPKNHKTRRITPAPAIMRLLQEQKRKQAEQQLKAGALWSNPEGFVFTDDFGNHLAQKTVYQHFKRVVKALGIPEARFHDMRHSYAVAALQAGDDVKTVQENLGHHTAAFTLDVYGHVTERMKQESAARMDRFIQSVTGA